jgi:hypothetical protein
MQARFQNQPTEGNPAVYYMANPINLSYPIYSTYPAYSPYQAIPHGGYNLFNYTIHYEWYARAVASQRMAEYRMRLMYAENERQTGVYMVAFNPTPKH